MINLAKPVLFMISLIMLSACVVETDKPLFLANEAVAVLPETIVITSIKNEVEEGYIRASKQADDSYMLTLSAQDPVLNVTFNRVPDFDNVYALQLTEAEKPNEYSYVFASINGNEIETIYGDALHAPTITSQRQLFDYFGQITASGETTTGIFKFYDMDDPKQAAEIAPLVKARDENRAKCALTENTERSCQSGF